MLVSKILERKGTHVIVAEPSENLRDLARLLNSHNVGAAVVVDEGGSLAGIVSERDILRAIAAHGKRALRMRVGELMSTEVVVCKLDDDFKHVMAVMTRRRVRHLPVIENDALAGIVSIGDVVKARFEETDLEINVLRDYARVRAA